MIKSVQFVRELEKKPGFSHFSSKNSASVSKSDQEYVGEGTLGFFLSRDGIRYDVEQSNHTEEKTAFDAI